MSPLGSQADPRGDANGEQQKQPKKGKRVRLLLDARTELTNEELEVSRHAHIGRFLAKGAFKRARANYLEGQALLRREMEQKRAEKESARLIEEMIWGAPLGGTT